MTNVHEGSVDAGEGDVEDGSPAPATRLMSPGERQREATKAASCALPRLRCEPRIEPEKILNQSQLLSATSETSQTFTVLLGVVAALSLLVGGIGITNIMLVAVTERTREIGIRKAVGAGRADILWQFLLEATLLSLVGGTLGVAAGVIGSQFTIVGVEPVIVPGSILLAFGVSIAIGLFFGSYPAGRAARLLPVEAIRHE